MTGSGQGCKRRADPVSAQRPRPCTSDQLPCDLKAVVAAKGFAASFAVGARFNAPSSHPFGS
jgi:hypothetical protein